MHRQSFYFLPPIADGRPATIPAKIIIEIPFPTPRSVICSPSQIKNINTVELKYDYLDKIKETEITIDLLKKHNLVNNKAKKVKIIGPVTISSKKKLVDVVATKSVKEFIK